MIDAVSNVLRVPNKYRVFSESQESLSRRYGISEDLVAKLLDLGLPHARGSATRNFDARDVDNIAIHLQLPNPRWLALQRWAKAFANAPTSVTRKIIGIYAECNRLHSGAQCLFTLDPVFRGSSQVFDITKQRDEFLVSLQMPVVKGPREDEILPLVVRAGELTFHLLCDELASDTGFSRDTGLADCRLASLDLSRAGGEAGIKTRTASGLFAATPFPSRHAWIEVNVGTGWLSLDPFLLSTMARWRILDPDKWPPHSSPSAMFLRLHRTFEPLMYDNGAAATEHYWTVSCH